MNSYFITKKGVDLIGLELSELAENHGLDHLADWCPNAVANEIVGKADFDLDMQRNGHFVHELGIRAPRGHILTITIDRSHCESLSFEVTSCNELHEPHLIGGYRMKDDGVHGLTVTEIEAGWSFYMQGDDADNFRSAWETAQGYGSSFGQFLRDHEYYTLFEVAS